MEKSDGGHWSLCGCCGSHSVNHYLWMTNVRAKMVSVTKSREYFEYLVEKLNTLKPHNHMSKSWSAFSKEERIILADFSENLTSTVKEM